MFKGKRVFVSGGAGVIGRELVKKLHDQNATIFVGDLKPRPQRWPKDIKYRQGDLNYITQAELEDFAPDYFFHLAATFERSLETYDFWEENYHHNLRLSHHLMTCLRNTHSLKRIIFASSYLIYNPALYSFKKPQANPVSLTETDDIYPRNLTGVAKLIHEVELQFLDEFSETPFTSVSARIFRVYGKDSRDIISRWIRALLNDQEINVYRKEGFFDYIYAEDVAEGLLLLAMSSHSGIVNLGTGQARQVSEVLDILSGYFPNMKSKDVDSHIPYEASVANLELLTKATHWLPPHKLEDAIPKIIEHEKKNLACQKTDTTVGNVLITSISKKVPLIREVHKAAKKVSGNIKVYGGDIDSQCIGSYFVDAFWEMPRTPELKIEELIVYCKDHQINSIIPTRDGELAFLAANKDRLSQNGITAMISNTNAVNTCLDKLKFYHSLAGNGYPVINTSEDIRDLDARRYVVKERFGAGAKSIGINLSEEEAKKAALELEEPVFQPFVRGQEISIDLYARKDGKVKGQVCRSRDIIVGGESQVTTTFENQELEKMCIRLVEDLNLYGHVVIQVIIDDQSNFHIVECNCRFGGASPLSIAAGVDTFYWLLLESNGEPLDEYPFIRSRAGKKLVRYAEDLIL